MATSNGLGSGREATRESQRRGRVSAPVMRERYPDLSSLQVNFDFSDCGQFVPSPQVTVFHPPAPAYFCFACPYSDCDGAFNLTKPVDFAVHSTKSDVHGQVRCAGMRHKSDPCTLCLEYSISPHR